VGGRGEGGVKEKRSGGQGASLKERRVLSKLVFGSKAGPKTSVGEKQGRPRYLGKISESRTLAQIGWMRADGLQPSY